MNDQYAELYASYQWLVPSQFNIAQACAHRWAQNPLEGKRIAIFHEGLDGRRQVWTYTRLSETANQLANGLMRMGVRQGDRVALLMAQRPEAAACYMAIFSAGAIAVPFSAELPAEVLASRLKDADTRVAFVDGLHGPALISALSRYPELSQIVGLEFHHESTIPWRTLLARQPNAFKEVPTRARSPALLLYEDSDAQKPVGVVLAHASLIGNLPGFVAGQNWYPRKGDVFWSPARWSSPEGLMSSLLPALYFGRSIVATETEFSPERALALIDRYQVTNTLLDARALHAAAQAAASGALTGRLPLRAIMTDLGAAEPKRFESVQNALGVTPNVVYGRPEMNNIIGNSHHRWAAKPGSMGRPYPGHRVAVLDPQGSPCPEGVVGQIALNRYDRHGHPDPVLFQAYWRNQAATEARFLNDWCLSNDLASVDDDGYFWYAGRANSLSPDARPSCSEPSSKASEPGDMG